MSKTPPPTTTTSAPKYPPESGPIFAHEKNLLQNFVLPAEKQRIADLSALTRGNLTGAPAITSPALQAGRLAQAHLGARLSGANLPNYVTAPLEEAQAAKIDRLPQDIAATAPEQLSQIVQTLIGPQFGSLFAPGSQGTTSGGGPSDFQTGTTAAGVAVAIASAVAIAI